MIKSKEIFCIKFVKVILYQVLYFVIKVFFAKVKVFHIFFNSCDLLIYDFFFFIDIADIDVCRDHLLNIFVLLFDIVDDSLPHNWVLFWFQIIWEVFNRFYLRLNPNNIQTFVFNDFFAQSWQILSDISSISLVNDCEPFLKRKLFGS